MVYFLIIYLIILIVMFSNIGVEIINEKNKTMITINILYIIRIKISSKRLIKIIENIKNKGIKEEVLQFKTNYLNIIKPILSRLVIVQSNIIYYEQFDNININNAFFVSTILDSLKYYLKNNTLRLIDFKYQVRIKEKRDIDFRIKIKINIYDLIKIGINYLKYVHNNKKESRYRHE